MVGKLGYIFFDVRPNTGNHTVTVELCQPASTDENTHFPAQSVEAHIWSGQIPELEAFRDAITKAIEEIQPKETPA